MTVEFPVLYIAVEVQYEGVTQAGDDLREKVAFGPHQTDAILRLADGTDRVVWAQVIPRDELPEHLALADNVASHVR